jgi:polar amino acid transport system permease protein
MSQQRETTVRGVRIDGGLPGWRRVVGGAAVALFWGWLVVRWLYDWVIAPDTRPGARESFFPVAPFEAAAESSLAVAESLGVLGIPFNWLGGVLNFVAGAIPSLPALASGTWLTIVLTVVGIALGFVIAVPLSVARVYGNAVTRWVALSYTELIRGTPLLAQLFVLYFGTGLAGVFREMPFVGTGVIPDQAVWVAVVGFTINSSAYQAEYIRSALISVEEGQLTAARAIGLSKVGAIRYVILPQGLRYAIPGWSNELVYLIKYSSLATFITVEELYGQAEVIANETYQYTDLFITAGLFYLALVLSASLLMSYVEDYTAIPGLGADAER